MDKRRRVIRAAFDTETANIPDLVGGFKAYPCLYQLGVIKGDIMRVTPENVADKTELYIERHAEDLYAHFDDIAARWPDVANVILVHNLSFDMYALAPYINAHDCRVLAKTARKPIAITVNNDNGEESLIFLDTLGLYMKSLETLGSECGMPKAVGSWDYNLIRTPETELTDAELTYASRDIYTLIAYTAYFLRLNPDIAPDSIADRVYTKTGVVREKRSVHIGRLRAKRMKNTVRQTWHMLNKANRPKSDDELFTMHAATRGGFTFCASKCASVVYHASDGMRIESYDSTSQHPAMMCTHLYPEQFAPVSVGVLKAAIECVEAVGIDAMLRTWVKPFPCAFYACVEYDNLRLKPGTLFEKCGIAPLASARIKAPQSLMYANEAQERFRDHIAQLGYCDSVEDATLAFGKVEGCKTARLFVTELTAWEISQCYDYDAVRPIHGYATTTFRKPSDMSILSVMRFYKAKSELKSFMRAYKEGQPNDVHGIRGLYPDSFVYACEAGSATSAEINAYYMLAKSDLNSIFGIEATNEARRDYEIDSVNGLELVGTDGIHNLPKSCKCNYQYGQRIVGWSRIAQICVMSLVAPHVEAVICGDTDSLKLYYHENNAGDIERALKRYARAIDAAKRAALARVKIGFGDKYDKLDGIGHYVFDGAYEAFSASWNKCYISMSGGRVHCTIAGIPTSRRSRTCNDSYDDFCNALLDSGWSFDQVAALAIGYNVTVDHSITKLNMRHHPTGWALWFNGVVTDYRGKRANVNAPHVLALAPLSKTLGDTLESVENARNAQLAIRNNPGVNITPAWVKWDNGNPIIER